MMLYCVIYFWLWTGKIVRNLTQLHQIWLWLMSWNRIWMNWSRCGQCMRSLFWKCRCIPRRTGFRSGRFNKMKYSLSECLQINAIQRSVPLIDKDEISKARKHAFSVAWFSNACEQCWDQCKAEALIAHVKVSRQLIAKRSIGYPTTFRVRRTKKCWPCLANRKCVMIEIAMTIMMMLVVVDALPTKKATVISKEQSSSPWNHWEAASWLRRSSNCWLETD